MRVAIAPSVLSADFARLGEQVRDCELNGADRLHIDVMDGHFVPNLSMGPAVVASLRNVTKLPLEVHLMVERPDRFFRPFAEAGGNTLIPHVEVTDDPRPWFAEVRRLNCRVGLAIRPDTPIERLAPYLSDIDIALCMTVFPGYAGQAFLPGSLDRIRQLRDLIDRIHPACELEVDGGINLETGGDTVSAGANVLVAATSIFQAPHGPAAAVREFVQRFARSAHDGSPRASYT